MSDLLDVAPHWHYGAAMIFCLVLTAPLELVIGARVYRRPRRLLIALVGVIPFVIWDTLATRAGHWWFADDFTLGVSIGNLPIEELSFFVVIPICGILTYEAVRVLTGRVSQTRRNRP